MTDTVTNNTPPKKKRFKRTILIILGVLIILAIPVYIFRDVLYFEYYNLSNNHAHANDKLYAAEWMGKTDGKYTITLYRTAEPVNGNGKKIAIDGGWVINSDSLAKHNSNFIGYYQGYKILDTEFGTKMLYYQFGTNKLGLERRYYESEIKLPTGYKFTDEPFYVLGFEVSTNNPAAAK
ncbi:hypothetical protein NAF17_11465 [Mucilaginibacter sp. RB4R14]|uniref:hypothetical protein n=1 Tax=Mucilaginibacter aurantiaciroseus TaxID=2949308 RepID=UPI002090E851|nr:hypothetical protein [Mucilaginibacter aurantiaciroseus]MCO5936155.1 hypothetical protein [Mucilaginibacter aurantiaciroseus]